MAVLTKVRVPVSDIARISNGTTAADIASSGADITETVSGALVGTWGTGGLTIPAAKVLTAKQVTGETVLLATAAGASATVKTTGTKLQVGTTSAHVMELLANAVLGLSVGTDGKVTLGVQGTAGGHLVNKTYVDSVASSASSTVATIAGTGQISIPNSTGNNLIVKWGQTNGLGALTQVTFAVAFPNAIFVALTSPLMNVAASSDGQHGVYDLQLAGFKINQANKAAATNPWCWIAIGY